MHPRQRLLLASGQPQRVGNRAFDLLTALVARRSRTCTPAELREAVWPDRVVEDNNLRVQITALRKLLGAGAILYLAPIGYRFMLQVQSDNEGTAAHDARHGLATSAPGVSPRELGADDMVGSGPRSTATNVPAHLPALLGREQDNQKLTSLLAEHARVTVIGPAGVGKTVMALALAHGQLGHVHGAQRFADGVWWLDLSAVSESARVVSAVAVLLQLILADGGQGPVPALASCLAEKRLLLVLDNCEHISAQVCELADALLRGAPGVVLLATSRRSLRCAGEQLWHLSPLALPEDDSLNSAQRSSAVALFAAQARRSDERFALTAANVMTVVNICRQLDGMALAICLAAARVRLLGVLGLQQRLDDQMRLLRSQKVDAPERHSALQAALDGSHALLAPVEQTVFRHLGVFAGSISLDAVQHLVGGGGLDEWAVLEALDALIDQSLLMADSTTLQDQAAPRYNLHQTIRVYARDLLDASGEAAALRARHAQHYLAVVQGPLPSNSAERRRMVPTLTEPDHDNVRAALDWALEHDIALAVELAASCMVFWRLRGHHAEAKARSAALLVRAPAQQPPLWRARLLLGLCSIHNEQNDLHARQVCAIEALALLRPLNEPAQTGMALSWLANAHSQKNEPETAYALYRESLAYSRQAGDSYRVVHGLNNVAITAVYAGRLQEATPLLEEALALSKELGYDWGTAQCLENLGEAAYIEDKVELAQSHWHAARALFSRSQHGFQESLMLIYLAQAQRRLGQTGSAQALLLQGLQLSLRQSFDALVPDGLVALAGVAALQGKGREAALLLGAAARERQRQDVPPSGLVQHDLADIEASAQALLAPGAWQQALAEGKALTPTDALMRFQGLGDQHRHDPVVMEVESDQGGL